MCVIWSISRAEEKQSTALFYHKRLVMLTVRFYHNKQVWRATTAQWLNSPVRDPAAMTHSLLSSLKEIHRDRQYIWSTTKHHRYFKKTSCQWLAPLRSGPSILGCDLSYECLFFFRSSCLPFCRSWTSEAGALFIFICFPDVLRRPAGDANRDLSEGYISVISRLSSGEREACLCRLHQGCCSTPDWDRWAVVLGMPDPIRWLRERMTGQKKNEERKTLRFSWQGWRRSAQTLCVIERREWQAVTEGWLSRCGITADPRTAIGTEPLPLMIISQTL